MSDDWADSDDPRLRALCGYGLRAHVRYQDGRDSLAPALVFADADYEVGDGTCGLHPDGKQANEPAIVYVRADALIDANARIAALEAERDKLREQVRLRLKLDELRESARDDAAALASNGGTRVWLNGGITNPGSPESTTITIYGLLSEGHREKLLDVAREIDRAALAETEGE